MTTYHWAITLIAVCLLGGLVACDNDTPAPQATDTIVQPTSTPISTPTRASHTPSAAASIAATPTTQPTATPISGTPAPTVKGGDYRPALVSAAQTLTNASTYRYAIEQRITVNDGTHAAPVQMDIRGSGEYAANFLHQHSTLQGSGHNEIFDIYSFDGNLYYRTQTQGLWRRVLGGVTEPSANGPVTGATFTAQPFALSLNMILNSGPITYTDADNTVQLAYTPTPGTPTASATPGDTATPPTSAKVTPTLAELPPPIYLRPAQRYQITFNVQGHAGGMLSQFGPDAYLPAILFARLPMTTSGDPLLTGADATIWVEPGSQRTMRVQSHLTWRDSNSTLNVDTLMAFSDFDAPSIAVSPPLDLPH